MSAQYPKNIEEIELGETWVVLLNKSIHVPGDERSRQAPGHGYPAHDEPYVGMEVYFNVNALKERIAALYQRGEKFKVVKMQTVEVSAQVNIEVDIDGSV